MADIRKLIQTGPNRDTLRSAFPILNMVIDSAVESATTANEAKAQSTEAVSTANNAKQQSEYVQTQLDTVTGANTIDPAVEQMKVGSDGSTVYNSPDERIREEHNSVTAQLAQNVTRINNRHSKFAMGTMSLKDEFYGLTGDSSVDASDVIEDIMLSLPSSGGLILVPEGDFKITRPLTVGATGSRWNVVFQGQAGPSGYEGSRFVSDTPNLVMFNVLGHGVEFRRIGFKGDGTYVRGYDSTITALKIGDGTAIPDDFTVDGCMFFRLKRGIHALTRNYYIRNSTFGHIQQYGIYMDGLAQTTETNTGFGEDYSNRDNIISFNRFHGLNGDAIYSRLTTVHKEIDISHNLIDDVNRGVVGAFIRSKINSNTLGRIRSHGIYVDNTGYDESVEVDGNTIVGISGNLPGDAVAPATNAFNYETGDGIHVTSKSAKINNNTVMHKAQNGIWLGTGSEGSQINDNTVINADNYNTSTYDAITNSSNGVSFDGNIIKRTTSIGKHRHSLNNSGGGCYFGAGNQYGSSSGSKVFNDSANSSVGYASNLGMYRKVLYGGANPSVTPNLQKGDRWVNVLAATGNVAEYQFDGAAWKPLTTMG